MKKRRLQKMNSPGMQAWKSTFNQALKKNEEDKRREDYLDRALAPEEKDDVKEKLAQLASSPRPSFNRGLTMSDMKKARDDQTPAVSLKQIVIEKDQKLEKAGSKSSLIIIFTIH